MGLNKSSKGKSGAQDSSAGSDRQAAAFLAERRKVTSANLEKTLQLKALRLAKEAQDKAALALLPAKPVRKRSKKAVAAVAAE